MRQEVVPFGRGVGVALEDFFSKFSCKTPRSGVLYQKVCPRRVVR